MRTSDLFLFGGPLAMLAVGWGLARWSAWSARNYRRKHNLPEPGR